MAFRMVDWIRVAVRGEAGMARDYSGVEGESIILIALIRPY